MSASVTETRGLPGVPASAAAARAFVREALLSAGCPDVDGPELCVSEMVANSAEHSWSAAPAGIVMVRVAAWPGGARIEVHDAGPLPGTLLAGVPVARAPEDGESGRGLWIVAQVADTCGFEPGVAWCQFFWPCDATGPAAAPAPSAATRCERELDRLATELWPDREYLKEMQQ